MMKRIYQVIFLIIVALSIVPVRTHAAELTRPAITVINPVRGPGLGHETDDLVESLKAQFQVTREAGVHATWLFQYGALEDDGMTGFAKGEMQGEEFGLLFEIDRNFAQKSGVSFRGQGPWYTSDGLFLISYDRSERRKLIDTAFAKFKKIFGYWPKTVGAWWIGGDSLTYMQERYGITAAMRAADQFNLDFYSIWGTPWDIPYLPSKVNEGIPAVSFNRSAKVVILQWAIRDPVRGYGDPLYSLQDFPMKGYASAYTDYLASVFLREPSGNMVIGLENGGTLEKFREYYQTMLTKAVEIQASGSADILLARDYADRFLSQKSVFAGTPYFLSTDYKTGDQSFWYVSTNFRAFILKTGGTVSLIDLRNYTEKTAEDFAVLPNSDSHLRINEPTVIDSMRSPGMSLLIKTTSTPLAIKEQGDTVALYSGDEKLASFTPTGFTVDGGKTFSFVRQTQAMTPLQILIVLYILYMGFIAVYTKNIRTVWREYTQLLIPFVLALTFLTGGTTFLFEKKEIVLLTGISLLRLPVLVTFYIAKILPFIILFVLHYVYMVKRPLKKNTFSFWGYYALTIILYLHVPYFPLDKTTYTAVGITFTVIAVILVVAAVYIYRKNRTKRVAVTCAITVPVILFVIALTVGVSRSTYAVTPFELQALKEIRSRKKDVVYVEQVDYSVRPIYKAVRPLLYANYQLVQLLTGRKWDVVMRPESNVLKLTEYADKIIVVPRYLGSDLSDYEMTTLGLTKIFDNAQIASYVKQ